MAVECKRISPDAPLVVSGRPRTAPEAYHETIYSEQKNGILAVTMMRTTFRNLVYPAGVFVGKSALQFKPDSNRQKQSDTKKLIRCNQQETFDLYNRWAQSIASSHELIHTAACEPLFGSFSMQTVVLPIVVLPNDTLWHMPYASDGVPAGEPEPQDEITYYVGRKIDVKIHRVPSFRMHLSHIHFVTLKGLASLLDKFSNDVGAWEPWFSDGEPMN